MGRVGYAPGYSDSGDTNRRVSLVAPVVEDDVEEDDEDQDDDDDFEDDEEEV